MSLVTVQSESEPKRKSRLGPPFKAQESKVNEGFHVHYRVNTVDSREYQKMAVYLHSLGVIKNPTIACFAHTSLRKWYNEINEKLGEGKEKNA